MPRDTGIWQLCPCSHYNHGTVRVTESVIKKLSVCLTECDAKTVWGLLNDTFWDIRRESLHKKLLTPVFWQWAKLIFHLFCTGFLNHPPKMSSLEPLSSSDLLFLILLILYRSDEKTVKASLLCVCVETKTADKLSDLFLPHTSKHFIILFTCYTFYCSSFCYFVI